ncbi:signal recognition particle-docking protein FtsY [archaeon CG07_land_8_20_14_0_80_38_8]|nr:MAG: signal recognition particle-docking protein FtsY [archaeon CG07_land_8_20_14_0_80_38_8]PIU88300.1 MAG: signal recognition particle-docking protein FtsY [archaeon CG06_land_8_20_14_3_00_37_11]
MFDFFKKKINEVFKKVEKAVTETKLGQNDFDKIFWELELTLLQSNVSAEVTDKVKASLESELIGKSVKRDFKKVISAALMKAFDEVLIESKEADFLKKVKSKKPFIIMIVGVNGSGKTTTISKLAYYLKKKGLSIVLAAGDTFRAASIEQLKHHAEKLGVDIVANDYDTDSASVAFDAVRHAEKKSNDVVIIDTAGRLHSNKNLMDELKKVKRVNNPDMTIFVADAITGNDVVEQARVFNEEISIDSVILTKTDVDNKGGAILSVGYTIKKPIIFLGSGQEYENLKHFKKEEIIKKLF